MKTFLTMLLCVIALGTAGCVDVETSSDAPATNASDTPAIEVGDAPVDLDPRTDDDIDIDTPAPGDR